MSERKKIQVPCPDGKAGCAVFHFKYEDEISDIEKTKEAIRREFWHAVSRRYNDYNQWYADALQQEFKERYGEEADNG